MLSSSPDNSYNTTWEGRILCQTAHAVSEDLDLHLFYSNGSQHLTLTVCSPECQPWEINGLSFLKMTLPAALSTALALQTHS